MRKKQKKMYPSFENRDYFLDLGEHVAYYRKKSKITQAQLAEKLDIKRTYLSNIENPFLVQSFSLNLLFDISRALDIPVYYFFSPLPDNNTGK